MSKRILITGAGGFIGGYLVAEALKRGYDTWAAVRATTSREFLADERIHFLELDFTDEQALAQAIATHVRDNGPWHYVVHNLGATKCTNYTDFERINYGYLRELVEALRAADAMPQAFLMMSSLSVMGMGDEVNYTPFQVTDVPNPNTRYGMSKLKAETYLQMQSDVPFTIFRCTGVYGPHERDYYLMIKSIARGFDFGVGFKKQLLTFIYVEDLAVAAIDALEHGAARKTYFISEGKSYTQSDFRKIVQQELNKRWVIPVRCPMWLVRVVCAVAEWWGKVTIKPSTLNGDKYKILRQRNWQCSIAEAQNDFGFAPRHDLRQGLQKAIAWYRQAGWL